MHPTYKDRKTAAEECSLSFALGDALPAMPGEAEMGDRRENDSLSRFALLGVEETGRRLGEGCFSVVVGLRYQGLHCAGKTIRSELITETIVSFMRRMESWCETQSALRHPNIVTLIGVHYKAGLPTIVTEELPMTLAYCVERHGVLPAAMSYGILMDVALGLRYLHERSQPVVHCDLSATNVLLTKGMSAKLGDVGAARLVDWCPGRSHPGKKVAHLPPEAHKPDTVAVFTTNGDVFSYGVLIIHVLTGRWPEPDYTSPIPTPVRSYSMQKSLSFTEADGFSEYLEDLGEQHPMMELVLQCLEHRPEQRPVMAEVSTKVSVVAARHPPAFSNSLEILQAIKECRTEQADLKKKLSCSLDEDVTDGVFEVERLQLAVDKLKAQNIALQAAASIRAVPPVITSTGIQPHEFTNGISPVQVSTELVLCTHHSLVDWE